MGGGDMGALETGDVTLEHPLKRLVHHTLAVSRGSIRVLMDAIEERDKEFMGVLLFVASELLGVSPHGVE